MSLNASLNTALSGLQVNQNLMRIVSSNIANVGTAGYTKKTAELSAIYLNDIGGGVQIDQVRRVVDDYLVKQINQQTSAVSASTALSEFYTRLQDMFGTPEENSSISGLMNTLRTSFEQLATDPQQSVNQFTAVTSATDVANALNNLSVTIQSYREEVDRQVGVAVDTINTQLQDLDRLNDDIVRNQVLGLPVGDLLDKRDIALQKIAEQIDVKWFIRDNGAAYVMTGSNYTLLDNEPRTLEFSSPTGVSKSTVYPGGFRPIEIVGGNPDITTLIKSGRVASLIDLRDNILPGLQDQIDQLTSTLAEEVNRAHASAMPIPGLSTFTGTTAFTTADLLDPANPQSVALNAYTNPTAGFTEYGSLQFAVIDSSGSGVGSALRVNLDEFKAQMEAYVTGFTGTPYDYQLTVGDIINMLNGAYAATPPAGASTPATPAGWPGGVPWPPSPALVMPSTGSDIAGLYNLSGVSANGAFVNGDYARMVDGHLEIGVDGSTGYGIAIDDTKSTFAQAGETRPSTFNYLMQLNNLYVIDPEAASSGRAIKVRADIAADPSKVGRGYLSSIERIPGDSTTEEWYVGRGDGMGAQAMADAFESQYLFSAEGSLPASNQRITEYASSIIQMNARGAADVENRLEFLTNLKTELETRFGQISGVNIDEELAKLISIQNAYAASSRVVNTVNEMLDDLLGLIR